MILTAHQSMFMPWCGLIAKISSADTFVQFDEVPFEYHGFGNRNRIKTANGVQWLTVPVHLSGHTTKPLSQIEIAGGSWRRKQLRTIELAYQKAPYFDRYFPVLRSIYAQEYCYLVTLNRAILSWILAELGIKTQIINAAEQGFTGNKSELVLDMCLKLGATKYIFGSQGKDYADVEAFDRVGVEAWFQFYEQPTYPQLWGDEFVPNLSVIDLMMMCGPSSLAILKGDKA